MCVNYRAPRRNEIVALTGASIAGAGADWKDEIWRDYAAPIVRRADVAGDRPELIVASYGMLPKRVLQRGKKSTATMNARAETIGVRDAFSKAWCDGQTCLVPASCFYEPNYESGSAERWAIGMANSAAFCVAGLWRQWNMADDGLAISFTQITINADSHPLMKRFHKEYETAKDGRKVKVEKRSLVIVPTTEYGAWLSCRDPEIARSMLTLYPAALMHAWPAATGYDRTVPNVSRSDSLF